MASKSIPLFLCALSLLAHVLTNAADSSPSAQPQCHAEERSALLHFRQSLSINKTACFANPKIVSWNTGRGGGENCCSWDGIECDTSSGHVTSLDLSRSCLYGSIDSSSSLFRLPQLQRLNLGFNNFNNSQIPPAIGLLSRLTHLNLSSASFSGQVPTQVLELSGLISLDFAGNGLAKLQKPGLRSLAEKLNSLEVLHLNYVNISSTVPDTLANLSSLTSLQLRDCELHGPFPREIFHLPKLKSLSVRFNPKLTGILPEFPQGSPLEQLLLEGTGFSGTLPNSIGNLKDLRILDLQWCKFRGSIPSSLANLTQLSILLLSFNNFTSWTLPAWFGTLSELTMLHLRRTNLNGEIPSTLANLTHLRNLVLYSNQLTGQIPTWIANLTNLRALDLSGNKLKGPIPKSIFELVNLEILHLRDNSLSGMIEFDNFMKFRKLTFLSLSGNNLSGLITTFENGTFPNFDYLGLGSCNLSEIPDFLRSQNKLQWLDISQNKIHGLIPKWFWNMSTTTLRLLRLHNNFLSGFEQQPGLLPWKPLSILTLSDNNLQGILPKPPASTKVYEAANSSFYGNLPSSLCKLTSLVVLDLSDNNLSGPIPQCLGNSNINLLVLNLQGNHFHGTVPKPFRYGSQLRAINLSRNKLLGNLPRSLANCTMLKSFDVSENQINDHFPSWLGVVKGLKILNLRSNQFYGGLRGLGHANEFANLKILDLSDNGFSGNLPAEFFHNWDAVKRLSRNNFNYMKTIPDIEVVLGNYLLRPNYESLYRVEVINKGMDTTYQKIFSTLAVIDLSSNRFSGPIPESTGNLRGVKLLNLSHNCLTGLIPQSIGNLTELESLDLSKNSFSGKIPEQLTKLTALAVLNVSYNNLSGLIPHGRQFDTFQNNSYLANPGLCGNPLSRKCENYRTLPTFHATSGSITEFDWLVISMGYLSGLIIGWVIGRFLTTRKHEWFVETFGKR